MSYVFLFGGLVGGQIVDAYAQIRDDEQRLKEDEAEKCVFQLGLGLGLGLKRMRPSGASFFIVFNSMKLCCEG